MIKILFFIECLSRNGSIGGAEKVLVDLVNYIDKTEFDVTVQTVFPDSKSYMLSDNVKYKTIFKKENKITSFLYRVETFLGFTYRFHMKDNYNIEAAYLEYGPTKVIASSTNTHAVRLAWIHCDFEYAIKNKEAFKKKCSKYYQRMDRVVCVSKKVRDSFISIFGNSFCTDILYNVIDDKSIKDKALLSLPQYVNKKGFTLLAVGRFMPQKNYKRLLSSIKRLRDDGFIFYTWILGEGIQREMIEDYIHNNNLADIVTLFGFQNNPYPFILESDLLVCSSDFEGYSTFITEGLVLGKPILTTDCSGMKELLGDSEYGMIVDVDDESFYQGLKFILQNSNSIIPDLEQKARFRSQDFELQKLVRDTEQFLRSVM